ncbi:inositol monophosphatase family protein [Pseudonocardia sp. GCM10023141]|uniref:inositol monophosphatase family protein n=1 Tax=Pseudonocardia sp. GCM10023141 TaxID=3252653 RepID=UPI00361E7940
MITTAEPLSLSDLQLVVRMAQAAGTLAARSFEHAEAEVHHKADGSPVTPTDLAIEDLLRRRIARHFPGDAVRGEERPPTAGTSGRRWVLDPIGGTADFVGRVPLFSIDLAMEDVDGPAIAVSNLPMSRTVLAGGRGLGTWILRGDGVGWAATTRARVDDRSEILGATVCAHNIDGWSPELLSTLHGRCRLRDGVQSVLRLVTGRASAVVVAGGAMAYEDLACLPVLVQEAGGRVTDLSGTDVLHGDGSVLATNGLLHEAFLDLVRDLPRGR